MSTNSVAMSVSPVALVSAGMSGRVLVLVLALLGCPVAGSAQSQAANGSIEGTVTDTSGGVLSDVRVTLVGVDTGATRTVITNDDGVYRAPLLPLGRYRVVAELQGFKQFERSGITLGAGDTAVVHVALSVGDVTEVVAVTTEPPPIDPGKIDFGRTLSEREVKNLPLVSRNPYNFALMQPAVTGYENVEFGVPRIAANGTLLRVNYQIDGNTNTQKNSAGLRLLPISEVMMREVKVVTSGHAPEFGQTTGLVYNVITPSGTNTLKGSASYRFRRNKFSAFPFFFPGPRTPERKPDTNADTVTAEVGGPIVRDRLHYYAGVETTARDLSSARVITIRPEDATRIGLTPQPGAMPAKQDVRFIFTKADYQLAPSHRLTTRYIRFANDSPRNNLPSAGGTPTSTEWATDFLDSMNSAAAQLASSFGANRLNELRVQFANRHQRRSASDISGSGPAIRINGVANFGGPYGDDDPHGSDFRQDIWQVIDNFTWIRGNHSVKVGFDAQLVSDARRSPTRQFFTFATIDDYLAARNGERPHAYATFSQLLGNPDFEMSSGLYSLFAQDDWRVTPNLKVLYGVRYDLYDYPTAATDAPFAGSRDFRIDRNNLGPRMGLAWTIDPQTVLRASIGVMFDQPLLGFYEQAIQQNGLPVRTVVNVSGMTPGAPPFPQTLNDLPPGFARPAPSISTVSPDFDTGRTIQNNIQFERAFGRDLHAAIGVVYVRGSRLPTTNYINLINPVSTLADGRPIFSTVADASTRLDPRFNRITEVQAVGESDYKALSLQVGKRLSHGLQFDLTYTYGNGTDTAPLIGTFAIVGDDPRSDPTNLDRDKGPNLFDVRHNFAGTILLAPRVDTDLTWLSRLANDNQIGILLHFNSGLPFNVRADRDLNQDGDASNDRPLFVGRNSYTTPARYNVDVRYSRFVPIRGSFRAEVLAEFKNVFNTVQIQTVNRVVATDAAGAPLVPLPQNGDGFAPTSGYEQRQFQLGFKMYF